MCPAEHSMIHSADPCRHPTVHSRKLGDTASHSSLSSCGLALLTVAHQALMIVSVSTSLENIQWKRQPLHVSKRVVFLPLRGLSLTLPRANTHFSQSSSVAVCGGALLNHSRNVAITWDMVCPVCCLSCTPHSCHQVLLDRVTACVSHMENTTKFYCCGKSCMHYLAHCCQTTILHCTACCAVLCKLILSLRCVLSGSTLTSRPPCTLMQK